MLEAVIDCVETVKLKALKHVKTVLKTLVNVVEVVEMVFKNLEKDVITVVITIEKIDCVVKTVKLLIPIKYAEIEIENELKCVMVVQKTELLDILVR
jgi:hypothetical protein